MKTHTCYYLTSDGKAQLGLQYSPATRTGGLLLQVPAAHLGETECAPPQQISDDGEGRWFHGDWVRPISLRTPPARLPFGKPAILEQDGLRYALDCHGDRLLVVTGAGLSIAAGVWGLDEIYELMGLHSLRTTLDAVVTRPASLIKRFELFVWQLYCKQPTPAHHALRQLQEWYNFTLATENRDDLHQKAGQVPITRDALTGLDFTHFQALLLVGVSEDRFSLAPHFRNRGAPVYSQGLAPCDGATHWIPGDCQVLFPDLLRELRPPVGGQ